MKADYESSLSIPVLNARLQGDLVIPHQAKGIVLFSHGSGSSRHSARNRMVAARLQQQGIGTLLFDLLTEAEDAIYANRFNIDLLASRLVEVTDWVVASYPDYRERLGYFGASTGAASALKAAAGLQFISAVVSRGGRPDLALDVLHRVTAPVLLLVGSLDYEVLLLNQKAYLRLNCEKKLSIIDGATHLFEEPGTLDKVADEAAAWFGQHLGASKPAKRQSYVQG